MQRRRTRRTKIRQRSCWAMLQRSAHSTNCQSTLRVLRSNHRLALPLLCRHVSRSFDSTRDRPRHRWRAVPRPQSRDHRCRHHDCHFENCFWHLRERQTRRRRLRDCAHASRGQRAATRRRAEASVAPRSTTDAAGAAAADLVGFESIDEESAGAAHPMQQSAAVQRGAAARRSTHPQTGATTMQIARRTPGKSKCRQRRAEIPPQ